MLYRTDFKVCSSEQGIKRGGPVREANFPRAAKAGRRGRQFLFLPDLIRKSLRGKGYPQLVMCRSGSPAATSRGSRARKAVEGSWVGFRGGIRASGYADTQLGGQGYARGWSGGQGNLAGQLPTQKMLSEEAMEVHLFRPLSKRFALRPPTAYFSYASTPNLSCRSHHKSSSLLKPGHMKRVQIWGGGGNVGGAPVSAWRLPTLKRRMPHSTGLAKRARLVIE